MLKSDGNITLDYSSILNKPSNFLPNLSAGVSLAANTAAPSDGWVFATVWGQEGYWNAYIDGVHVAYEGGSKIYAGYSFTPIAKGSTFSVASTFYPCRG